MTGVRTAAILLAVALVAALDGGPAAAATPAPKGYLPPTFAAWDALPVGSPGQSVAVGDFTGDGRLDAALTTGWYFDGDNDYKVFLYVQSPSGTMGNPVRFDTHAATGDTTATAADVDGDGDTDLVVGVSAGVDVYEQRDGGLLAARFLAGPSTLEVDVFDLTVDGVADLVLRTSTGVVVLAGTGGGAFSPAAPVVASTFTEIELGDVTGDGVADLVGYTGTVVRVYPRTANGALGSPADYPVVTVELGPSGKGLALGDFNGDARTDVAVTIGGNMPASRLNLFYQQAGGTLAGAVVVDSYDSPQPLLAADMNLDGRTDLVTTHGGWRKAGIYTQRPDGALVSEQLHPVPYSSHYNVNGLAAGDLNGDGMPDFVVADYSAGLIIVPTSGQVQAWGLNEQGQLGNGATADELEPIGPIGLTEVVGATAGAYHNLALTRDGGVWTWGLNNAGQLGIGPGANRTTPVKVPGLGDVRSIGAGAVHSAAVRQDGSVWTWGWNAFGQLGLGEGAGDRSSPTKVPGLTDVVAVAGGLVHTLALKADGTVWAWGLGHVGQLGNGDTVSSALPVKVNGLSDVVAVAAGGFHSLALTRDGRVWAWGLNHVGQLGVEGAGLYETSAKRSYMYDASSIAAGMYHSVALRNWDGTVHGWGQNTEGQLGPGAGENRSYPVQAYRVSGVRSMAAGWYHTVAVTWSGQVYAWGWGYFGQLGTGGWGNSFSPVEVASDMNATVVGAGIAHSFAVTARGA